ncbi:MAG: hypothetical protein A2W01_11555 [Candidatus Solincola sediminis]|uniref:4Fe-4S ferredoxin-type domain-containing protein n=1 Tax=Candidatus Solincola sediminis TaxID=1797199 RepID=A0A1F2WTJ7_9ACTN|nr:MAG: hypothetical protein A2Y75_02150 [Candidatus Solincola sediminis]OFW60825.1 MAG: hypothetical protein A2W01_11555 [Candidatus Solincola sediminis]
MSVKDRIREKGLELGFEGVGFAGVEPMDSYIKEIESRPPEMYGWTNSDRFSTIRGASPQVKHPSARSLVVLISNYYRKSFPQMLEGVYGRAYLVDERKVLGEEMARIASFFVFLKQEGISPIYDGEIPARMAAARAGLITYGKNCFAYGREAAKNSSWIEIIPFIADVELEPDEPSVELNCPPKCKNKCMKACPTGAIYDDMKMNPLKCIAFNTYYGAETTPMELREPMGTWVYGCDACQEACPRNRPWMRQEKPPHEDLHSRMDEYDLQAILQMDQVFYEEKLWPRFFYISRKRIDRWHMNAARALGNLGNSDCIPALERSLRESPYENVRSMSAWALGRIGGAKAREILEKARGKESEPVIIEINQALHML